MLTGVDGCGVEVWFGKCTDIASLVLLFGFTTPAYILTMSVVWPINRFPAIGFGWMAAAWEYFCEHFLGALFVSIVCEHFWEHCL